MRVRVTVVGDAHVEVHRDGRGSREFVGGRGVDAAIGLAVLGDEATLVAAIGDDRDGERIRSVLHDFGVRLVSGGAVHGTARVVVDRRDGRRSVRSEEVAAPEQTAARGIRFDKTRAAIAVADLVVVSAFAFANDARFDELVAAVERPEARLLVDGDPRQPVDTVAAVAHLLAHGVSRGSTQAWDDALEAAMTTLATAARPGRPAPRSAQSPTERGS
ncbi:PfkB family carbohydrate kinase [Agromyces italicus]|uniref:PfkB family carbohydrate kinase n=1 Tax=Agromyces italicus TaxID=279572 RepID=UPI0003B2F0C9|nr:PfkB family carbohydrate kinase [Agromyces italicus]